MTFSNRNKCGSEAENEFESWLQMNSGWEVQPYGQGLMTEKSRRMMRNSGFNGDPKILESLLAEMRPAERNVYFDRINTMPNLARWLPDFVISYKNTIICAPDIKTSMSSTPNWAVEMSSILGNKLHSLTGVQCIYVFPPSEYTNYWTCATPDLLRQCSSKILDGKSTKGGSGTPFYLVPKRSIEIPLKALMTSIELTGAFKFVSHYGTVPL